MNKDIVLKEATMLYNKIAFGEFKSEEHEIETLERFFKHHKYEILGILDELYGGKND